MKTVPKGVIDGMRHTRIALQRKQLTREVKIELPRVIHSFSSLVPRSGF